MHDALRNREKTINTLLIIVLLFASNASTFLYSIVTSCEPFINYNTHYMHTVIKQQILMNAN